jgi:hypothetical protein
MIKGEERTSAATAARMRASEDKMARRLIERGWFCARTNELEVTTPPGMIMYATNGLRETYRVIGFDEDGRPFLQAGAQGEVFPGDQNYIYTVGKA